MVEIEYLVCCELIFGLVVWFEGVGLKMLKFDFSYEYNWFNIWFILDFILEFIGSVYGDI